MKLVDPSVVIPDYIVLRAADMLHTSFTSCLFFKDFMESNSLTAIHTLYKYK